ncbi:plasmid pRiA4b ORF-3 family protein [Rhodococcus sp. KBS0724]|uniref:plasmid pRiA4b ORF-3 family protein n=1 Tax=Rhodococcus sp. KBS0724 TaxID=1179674 RepID=UPI0021B0F9CE|nr:plasmid pRiA4b ORF-3 family protein [Rhodococcus sp. KBS0724]
MFASARDERDLTAAERCSSSPGKSDSVVAVSISACRWEDRVSTIGEAVIKVGECVRYEYNVRARWSHTLVLEEIVEDQTTEAPSCLSGESALFS